MMKRVAILALTLVAFSQVASAQSQPMTSSLYQTYNATAAQVGFGQCNESSPVVLTTPGKFTLQGEPLTQITDAQAQATTVDGIWFGGGVGLASNFQVVGNCSVLQLTANGGHGTTIFIGPVPLAPNGCTGAWYNSTNYLHLFVSITNTGFGWSVSLPTKNTVRAQTSCNGGYQYCPLATAVTCETVLNMPTVLKPDGTPAPAQAPPTVSQSVQTIATSG
jgi:hypothetical protein